MTVLAETDGTGLSNVLVGLLAQSFSTVLGSPSKRHAASSSVVVCKEPSSRNWRRMSGSHHRDGWSEQ